MLISNLVSYRRHAVTQSGKYSLGSSMKENKTKQQQNNNNKAKVKPVCLWNVCIHWNLAKVFIMLINWTNSASHFVSLWQVKMNSKELIIWQWYQNTMIINVFSPHQYRWTVAKNNVLYSMPIHTYVHTSTFDKVGLKYGNLRAGVDLPSNLTNLTFYKERKS